jgi:hypothetical protein
MQVADRIAIIRRGGLISLTAGAAGRWQRNQNGPGHTAYQYGVGC